jgi:hypothetical protein
MINFKRITLQNLYYGIEILNCPIEVILFAADAGADNVSVENFRNHRWPESVQLNIISGNKNIEPHLKNLQVDILITKSDFIALAEIWNRQGVYAVFHNSENLKFRATDLPDSARYNALNNFGWNLEIAVPDGSSGEWTRIVSTEQNLIDRIAQYCESHFS